jgi:hypothetical protein
MNERKEAIRKYKERPSARGIFVLECSATGRRWVDSTTTLDSVRNRLWFELKHGRHRIQELQDDWNTHGEAAFKIEVVETLDKDILELTIRDELKRKRKEWSAKLGAPTISP